MHQRRAIGWSGRREAAGSHWKTTREREGELRRRRPDRRSEESEKAAFGRKVSQACGRDLVREPLREMSPERG